MKKKILALALAVVLIAIAGYSTLAYFTSEDTAKNVISADTLEIQINEYQLGENDLPVLVDEGTNGITIITDNAVPGDVISKIPKVKNLIGNTDAWIRVRVTITCETAATDLVPPVVLDYDLTTWTRGGDGYYYYNSILPADTETSALFNDVTFNLDAGNEYQNAVITIRLDAQAVQSDNNPGPAWNALGWPAF